MIRIFNRHIMTKSYSWLILFVLTAIAFFSLTNNVIADNNRDYQVIHVQQGDNLWKIANRYRGETNHLSNVAFVKWVEGKNGINGDQIVPDQRLIIPVLKDHIGKNKKQ
ncbi:cell division suppressor protein YneA [Sporolactobacillus spathodeae]|uniref:LysM repeat protein n=1 Tax=Sporolactobacillus spathodeae TaxID=1465502 RepID=A0ABS2QAP4_9BACL|nr:LysM peptidoglycan-binding domain-containing protein [Sporolactobacillus spathodeae]MBM7658866.1 LysM repeat protein [Sporolactobacillus spathodeae]